MAAATITTMLCALLFIILAVVIMLVSGIRKIPENEQWVITRLGNTFVKRSGWMLQIPLLDQVGKVDMSEKPFNVQDQTCITSDRAPVIIHMLVYSRVIDPVKYASHLSRDRQDFLHLSSSTLKEMVSSRMLDQLLSGRDELGEAIGNKLNTEVDPALGMRIDKVVIMEIVVSKEILASMPVPGEFPSECPACGAPLNSLKSKATRQIKCEYCGYIISPLKK
jgi:regulator of protease activity HflC (stomatin/prohibitin superfamily)